jgi:hypothetical protein
MPIWLIALFTILFLGLFFAAIRMHRNTVRWSAALTQGDSHVVFGENTRLNRQLLDEIGLVAVWRDGSLSFVPKDPS